MVAGLALVVAGYGLAESAYSFGWWGPIIDSTEAQTGRSGSSLIGLFANEVGVRSVGVRG